MTKIYPEHIHCRVTAKEKKEIYRRAKKEGLSASRYLVTRGLVNCLLSSNQ